jgi:lipopolysaccharide transport system permease protein
MTASGGPLAPPLAEPAAGPADESSGLTWRRARELAGLVGHLAGRRLKSLHRLTLLGWAWPLARQLVQLAVLVFLFSHVLKLRIANYPLFVFSGLLVWNWFQSSLLAAAGSFIADRHLVFSPRLPNGVLPLVAVVVPLIDTLMALPIVMVALLVTGRLSVAILLLVPLLAVLFVMIAGLALLLATANVFVRDVENVVAVGLILLFYLTPVFYAKQSVPARLHWILRLNPMSATVSAARAVTLDGTAPAAADVATMLVGAGLAAAVGVLVYRRFNPDLIDEL